MWPAKPAKKKRDQIARPELGARNAVIWMLSLDDRLTLHKIAVLFDLSTERIKQVIAQVELQIARAEARETSHPTMRQTQRLIAAGALRRRRRPVSGE